MTDDDQIHPPKSLPLVACTYACVCVCALIKRPHTTERGWVCRFSGAPRALDAYISPCQRTLIAPSMSEQIHVCTSIHKASLTHTLCPPSPIFFLLPLFTRMWPHIWDSLRHMYTHTHNSLYVAFSDINDFHSSGGWNTHPRHACETDCDTFCFLGDMHTLVKLVPRGPVTHMPVQQRHSLCTWLVIWLRRRGLSRPESSLAGEWIGLFPAPQ